MFVDTRELIEFKTDVCKDEEIIPNAKHRNCEGSLLEEQKLREGKCFGEVNSRGVRKI